MYHNENEDCLEEEEKKDNGGNIEEMERNYLVNIYVFQSVIKINVTNYLGSVCVDKFEI
jgi:hypothetical protein